MQWATGNIGTRALREVTRHPELEEPAWELRPTGWRVRIDGDAPFDVALPFPVAVEELGAFTPAYTANRPVNAVPYVCAAAAGILATTDLPPITPAGT